MIKKIKHIGNYTMYMLAIEEVKNSFSPIYVSHHINYVHEGYK